MEDEIDFGAFNMEPVPEEAAASRSDTEPDRVEEKGSEKTDSTETVFGAEPTAQFPQEFDFEEESPARPGPVEFDFEEKPATRQDPMEFDFKEESSEQQGPDEFDFEEESPSQQGPAEFDFEEETSTGQTPLEFGFDEEDADGSAGFSLDNSDPFPDTETEDTWETETGAGAPEDFDFGEEDKSAGIDNFDLSGMSFGDEDSPEASQGEDFGNIPLEQAPEIGEKTLAPPHPKKSRAPSEEERPPPLPATSRRKSPFKGLLMFVLILLLVLCGVAGYFFWQRGNLDLGKIVAQFTGQGTPATVAGQIRLSELSSSFVTNREAGQLFVIHGKAINEYSETRSAIAVKGILYNKNGQALLQQTVFCGNPLDAESLRGMPFAKIEESMNNQFGDSLSNLNVGPGKAIPFTIVFKNLPPELAEYTVETVDSKPGSKP